MTPSLSKSVRSSIQYTSSMLLWHFCSSLHSFHPLTLPCPLFGETATRGVEAGVSARSPVQHRLGYHRTVVTTLPSMVDRQQHLDTTALCLYNTYLIILTSGILNHIHIDYSSSLNIDIFERCPRTSCAAYRCLCSSTCRSLSG